MFLRIRNFFRRIIGKKDISNLYYDPRNFVTVQDLWEHVDTKGLDKEAFLIIIDKNNISCYAKVAKIHSKLDAAILMALDQINNGDE